MLKLISIFKSFHDGESNLEVLKGIDLSLEPAESLALLGASGNGKSTLLQIAAGLETPDSGDVFIMGRSLGRHSERELSMLRRRHLGFVFQQFNLLPGLNVIDNLLFQRRLNRQPGQDPWTDEIIDVLDLAALLRRPVEVLSSGQQQRVAIARALAHKPRILFADEPTGNLHDTLSRQVMALMVKLVAESACSLLLVTHNQEMASFTDRRLVLEGGHLHESDHGDTSLQTMNPQ
jgi:putative ABC transport system ATP-binding protein